MHNAASAALVEKVYHRARLMAEVVQQQNYKIASIFLCAFMQILFFNGEARSEGK